MRILKGRWNNASSGNPLREFFFKRAALPVRKNPERLPAIHADALLMDMPYFQLLSADVDPDEVPAQGGARPLP